MARLLLGVSGGIAAYKALETARLAVIAGHDVRAILTPNSERFVGRASFEAITGAPVLTSEFDSDPARGAYPGEALPEHAPITHLALVQRAGAYLIAPASANTLAKLAAGLADNLLCTAALAADCPLAVAPAMNDRMWRHPATQANLKLLQERGVNVIEPREGRLASHGEHGTGRLAEPEQLLEIWEGLLRAPTLAGLRVLVSAGGTREAIDSVRYIGNRSSGRMGMALAREASLRGASVTLIAANVELEAPTGVTVERVISAAELGAACQERFPHCDVLLMAAAVADFRPSAPAAAKIKKEAGPPEIDLESTEDVLAALSAQRRPGQLLIGFAAEHGPRGVENARGKLERKALDAIVVNDISQPGIGFDASENEMTLITADGCERVIHRASKDRVASEIIDEVERLRATGEELGGHQRAGLRGAALN